MQTYDDSQDSSMGTCALLRHFSTRITHDFVLLPCDFVPPPSLPLSVLLNKFRIDGSIATACWYPRPQADVAAVDEWSSSMPTVSILWDKKTETLLHIESSNDLDHSEQDLDLRMELLNQCVF